MVDEPRLGSLASLPTLAAADFEVAAQLRIDRDRSDWKYLESTIIYEADLHGRRLPVQVHGAKVEITAGGTATSNADIRVVGALLSNDGTPVHYIEAGRFASMMHAPLQFQSAAWQGVPGPDAETGQASGRCVSALRVWCAIRQGAQALTSSATGTDH